MSEKMPGKKPGSKYGPWVAPAATVCLLLLVLGGMAYLGRYINGPPAGAYSEIVVEFYTDGSSGCEAQAEVIRQLEKDYTGPITFKTVDVRQNPDVTQSYQGSDFGAVKYLPAIRVSKFWYDKNGKVISSGWNMSGKMPKRDLVSTIEGSASSGSSHWPRTPVKYQPAVGSVVIDLDRPSTQSRFLYLYPGQSVSFVHGSSTQVMITPPYRLVVKLPGMPGTISYRAVKVGSGTFMVRVTGGPGRQGTHLINVRVR